MEPLRRQSFGPEAELPRLLPWSELGDESQQKLLGGGQPASLDRDAYLEVASAIVIRGVVAFERALSDGRRVLAALFHEGDLIDLRRSERVREGRLVAVTLADVLVFEEGWIDMCISHSSTISTVIDDQLKQHQSRLHDHITDLAAKTPLERVASVLFEFRRWLDGEGSLRGQPVMRVPLRRTDIADYLGMKAETLSRAVRCLEQQRLIRVVAADQILIIDVIGMRHVANGGRPRRSTKKG